MNEATLERARAAVASPHWRGMPGMRIAYANVDAALRVCEEGEPAYVDGLYHAHCISEDWEAAPDGELPDLSDPVTVEAVGILACEALGADAINVSVGVAPDMSGLPRVMWSARTYSGQRIASGSTLSRHVREAAYVAALEAAPTPEEK